MTLCKLMGMVLVARYTYSPDFSQEERDLAVLRVLRDRLGTLTVVVQSPDGHAHEWEEEGIRVRYIARRWPALVNLLHFLLRAAIISHRLARDRKIELMNASDLVGALALLPVRRITRVPLLLQFQFQFFALPPGTFPLWKRWTLKVLAGIAARSADSIRCVTEDIRRQALRAGVPAGKLRVIPTRCDTTMFDPARFGGVERDPYRFLYVGSLTRGKGIDVLLVALRRVVSHLPSVRLQILGAGPERRRLEREVARAGLIEAVEFLGTAPYQAVPALMASAGVFVYPSRSEAMPRAVLEAMAMELPVVASRVGGIAEVISDGTDGILVTPGNAEQLAEAMLRLVRDPHVAGVLGRRARQRIVTTYSFEQNIKAFAAWHQEVHAGSWKAEA